jgi:hypothetical protein
MKPNRFLLFVCPALGLPFLFSAPTQAEEFEWAIAPRFDNALEFAANGLAVVEVKGKVGYIDEKGKEVILPRFDEARPFAAGLAAVAVKGKVGYIDEKGKEVIPPRFNHAWGFAANGLAMVEVKDKWGYIRVPSAR